MAHIIIFDEETGIAYVVEHDNDDEGSGGGREMPSLEDYEVVHIRVKNIKVFQKALQKLIERHKE